MSWPWRRLAAEAGLRRRGGAYDQGGAKRSQAKKRARALTSLPGLCPRQQAVTTAGAF